MTTGACIGTAARGSLTLTLDYSRSEDEYWNAKSMSAIAETQQAVHNKYVSKFFERIHQVDILILPHCCGHVTRPRAL